MHKIVNGQRVELTAEEITQREAEEAAWQAGAFDRAIANLREDRNRRLVNTDWYALQDVTLTEDMRDYRQALRDLPEGLATVTDVDSVEWPITP